MNALTETPVNAVAVIDGFSDDNDPSASPIKGTNIKFKDGAYFAYSDEIDVHGKSYAVLDPQKGWQKLARECSPEYLMQKLGGPKPPQPHVDKKDWPKNLNGELEHPWKWTHFLYLLDLATGEISTFWSNTTGGNIAVGALSEQVQFARKARLDVIPVIALESNEVPTQYGGTKPRPHFRILGYRPYNGINPQNLIGGPAPEEIKQVEHAPIERAPAKPVTGKAPFNDDIGI
jgi:hypothetical protein